MAALAILCLGALPPSAWAAGADADAAAAPRQRMQPLSRTSLGREPGVRIHDTVLGERGARAAGSALDWGAQGFRDGFYAAGDSVVRIWVSPQYVFNPAVNRNWAAFLGSLVHGRELRRLTVVAAPFAKMQQICSDTADACYDGRSQTMVVTGENAPDGTPLTELIAHEYGHHIAANRNNAPWSAFDRGPKYWSTRENVCERTRRDELFPGDEGARYRLNPGEAWAETNRLLNGGSPTWPRLDPSLAPGAAALRAARRDILHPWRGARHRSFHGRARRGHRVVRRIALHPRGDGRVRLTLRTHGHVNLDLVARNGRSVLARSAHRHGTERIAGTLCGVRRLRVDVVRRSGAGRWKLSSSRP